MATTRPPLRRPKVLWLALAFALIVAGAGGPWPASGIAAVALALFVFIVLGSSWLLAPWSRTARRIVLPDPDTFDRQIARLRRVADGIGRIPVLGYVWRWA
jgi:membrane protein implicated in regulation of membrane protease activity